MSRHELKLGRRLNDKKSVPIFRNVVYSIDNSLESITRTRLINLLESNGAVPADNENTFNLYVSLEKSLDQPNVHSVTPLWIETAIINGFVHETQYYSPSKPNQFLSGVVLFILDISQVDVQRLTEEIRERGGQVRNDLTEDITHLICINPRGVEYQHCIDHCIPVVLPQWLDDCLRFGEKIDITSYRFPTPTVYNPTSPATIHPYPNQDHLKDAADCTVLANQVIYFGTDIHVKDNFKSRLIQYIKRAGGTVSTDYDTPVTIVILKHRSTEEGIQAFKDNKTIASLWWLTNTLARGYVLSPLSTLLDYPAPQGGIPGMDCLHISITGYRDVSRDFLRRLIIHTGAVFNPLMDQQTTHLICGSKKSDKYKEALNKGMTIVNHIWLEECYQQWKILDCDHKRYRYIPEKSNVLNQTLGRTHLLHDKVKLWMNPQTVPDYSRSKHVYEIINVDEKGSIDIVNPRKAAVKAIRVLSNIVMPDMNAYEKEVKSSNWPSHKKQKT
ncbi:hypothetical protein RMATCC62417_04630 [Rhizopus microsporus]|nr:hypothetical protein RMATCC62417_04630 [Rhizopus microsporus]